MAVTGHSVYEFIHSFTGVYSPGRTFGLPFRGFLITHMQTHGRTPLDYLYLHRTTQQTNIHAPIRTRDPSNQAAADLRLRLRGHWDRLFMNYYIFFRIPIKPPFALLT
jgi:hypothetical protein